MDVGQTVQIQMPVLFLPRAAVIVLDEMPGGPRMSIPYSGGDGGNLVRVGRGTRRRRQRE